MRALISIATIAALAIIVASCSSSPSDKEKVYDIKGKVVSVDTEKKTVRLDHEDIPGFMKAMEMDFDVKDTKIIAGLKAGDQVQGKVTRVNDGSYYISELAKR